MVITSEIIEAIRQEFRRQFPHAEVHVVDPAKGSYDSGTKSAIALYLDSDQADAEYKAFTGNEMFFKYSLDGEFGDWQKELSHRFLDSAALDGVIVSLSRLIITNRRTREGMSTFFRTDGIPDGLPLFIVEIWPEADAGFTGARLDRKIDAVCYRAFGPCTPYSWISDVSPDIMSSQHVTVTAYISGKTTAKPASDFIYHAKKAGFRIIRYGLTQASGGPMTFTAEIAGAESDKNEAISFETPF